MASSRKQRIERTIAMLAEPETFDDICDWVAEGKTLGQWTAANDVKFLMVWDWINFEQDRLTRYNRALAARQEVLTDNLLDKLTAAVNLDPRQMFDSKGNLIPIQDMDAEVAGALTGFEIVEERDSKGEPTGNYTHKIKYTPRHQSIELMGKHLGFTKDRVEVSGPNGGPIQSEDTLTTNSARKVAFLMRKAMQAQQPTGDTQS